MAGRDTPTGRIDKQRDAIGCRHRLGARAACVWPPVQPAKKLTPVALPPGRLRLATTPSLTGSPVAPNTIGIVVVTALAASAPVPLPSMAITLTPRSAANSANRPYWPDALND